MQIPPSLPLHYSQAQSCEITHNMKIYTLKFWLLWRLAHSLAGLIGKTQTWLTRKIPSLPYEWCQLAKATLAPLKERGSALFAGQPIVISWTQDIGKLIWCSKCRPMVHQNDWDLNEPIWNKCSNQTSYTCLLGWLWLKEELACFQWKHWSFGSSTPVHHLQHSRVLAQSLLNYGPVRLWNGCPTSL